MSQGGRYKAIGKIYSWLSPADADIGTLEERLELYPKVEELRPRGLQNRELAYELGISEQDASYWLRVERPSRENYVPDLNPRPDLAHLIGAYLGDGRTAGEQDKKVRFKVADLEFARLLNDLVAEVLLTEPKRVAVGRGFYCVDYDTAVLYDYLQQPLSCLIPVAESFPGMSLRGFFDAEGYATQTLTATPEPSVQSV